MFSAKHIAKVCKFEQDFVENGEVHLTQSVNTVLMLRNRRCFHSIPSQSVTSCLFLFVLSETTDYCYISVLACVNVPESYQSLQALYGESFPSRYLVL